MVTALSLGKEVYQEVL